MSFPIRIDNQIYAAWATINNTFTIVDPANWDRLTRYWNGVLIQVGDHTSAQTGITMDEFQHVWLKKGTEAIDITRQEFIESCIWVNIVADKDPPPREAPMTRKDLGELLIERQGNPPHPYRLRNHFAPFAGGVTIWVDRDDGFGLEATRGAAERMQFTFTLPMVAAGILTVQVYKDGDLIHDLKAGDVDEVQITGKGGGGPGDDKDPPQMGGTGG